ncbi:MULTISPECIES: ion channel [Zobellia]|uniref:ion channel n=1 Tax=Zobellia TaxID=112040 RepID=UPI00188B01E2|nr:MULTISPECIES: ion channel [Zobellia]MBU2947717.1 hypothetical protein [Zobellia uliginosa]
MRGRIIATLTDYKYVIALVSVFNFLLTPIHIAVSGFNPGYVIVTNFTLVILGSSLIASTKLTKAFTYVLGLLTLTAIWMEFAHEGSKPLTIFRLVISFALFTNLCILLLGQLRKIKQVNLQFILMPILGFLFLGLIGGILFEAIDIADPNSFRRVAHFYSYSFYYFSFISITTVGYGDITPLTAPAQSLTLVLNIIGQFYLAIVIAVFVGKYINVKS